MKKQILNISDAIKDIEGPEGKFRKYEQYSPLTEEIKPNKILTKIEEWNVLVTNFAEAAGINNKLSTNIIPTDCNEATIETDSKTINR